MFNLLLTDRFIADLRRIDKHWAKIILDKLESRDFLENPKSKCKPLAHQLVGKWRLRVENYRIIVEIEDNQLVVVALNVAHRKQIYGKS